MTENKDNLIEIWPEGFLGSPQREFINYRYKNGIKWVENIQVPTLEIFLPSKEKHTGRAIIICPGGGYQGLSYDLEGTDLAKRLAADDIVAFVLSYRLPSSNRGYIIPFQDAQRAIRFVRYHANNWNISKTKIGLLGFSAGGHLAATIGNSFNFKWNHLKDPVETASARPDFLVLVYPLITMKLPYTHLGSRTSLLGETPKNGHINLFSNELHVTSEAPPTFLIHSADDDSVSVMNSILYYKALQLSGINNSVLHVYSKGGHAFGLASDMSPLQQWVKQMMDWINILVFD